MNWRRYLIDVPAFLFSLWWRLYTTIMLAMFMVLATVMAIAMVLHFAFGIRWGW